MILYRYITKDIISVFIGVITILFLILLGTLMVRYLAEVADGTIAKEFLIPLVAIRALETWVLVVPLSFFLALIISLGRMNGENELIAAYACGFERKKLLALVVGLSIIVSLFVGGMTLLFAPAADQKYHEVMHQSEQQSDLSVLAPRKFIELSDGSLFYAEGRDEQQRFAGVSIFKTESDNYSVTNAKELTERPGDSERTSLMVMKNGVRTDIDYKKKDSQQISFAEYGVYIEKKDPGLPKFGVRAVPSTKLWGSSSPAYTAELQWRITLALMVIVLAVVAVVMSRYQPRSARGGKLILAMVVYMFYGQLLVTSKNGVAQQTLIPEIGLWWVHIATLTIALVIFYRQERSPV
ncbi:MAG: LPS export ABC transporter permease LptF [Gammaproteobacteria bacterium]|nr:LPS export ABC transporter permease LptF [Gammaproteobacteria bacterium]